MSIALIIVVILACLIALGAIIAIARTRASLEGRVQALADGLGQRSELAASLDLIDVLDRTLDAMVALPGVDAALVIVGTDATNRTIAAASLTDDEVERTIFQMPTHPDLRAIDVVYRYRLHDAAKTATLPRAAVTVALRAGTETIGSLAAITRSEPAQLPPATGDALDLLARRAGPAIANARRHDEAREQAEHDSLTGLHNRRLFYEFLNRELARGQRYERSLSLIVFDLDDFKLINDRIGHLGGDAVLVQVSDRIREVVRATDIACRVGGDEFAVILPESNHEDAELLAERIGFAVRTQIDKVGMLKISSGVAEARPDDSAAELFRRADLAMYRAKGAGKAQSAAS